MLLYHATVDLALLAPCTQSDSSSIPSCGGTLNSELVSEPTPPHTPRRPLTQRQRGAVIFALHPTTARRDTVATEGPVVLQPKCLLC
ncbi:hypothetical protein C8R45DRAFT_986024 [Mycena sanguinolenta]|nr:hypothetical protein C8R45DRAFT_986024 [Mycena sanguinolenta]